MKRKVMTLSQIREEQRSYFESMGENVNTMGICSLVDVENMGFCKDGVTRWYHFDNVDGDPCVYYKY